MRLSKTSLSQMDKHIRYYEVFRYNSPRGSANTADRDISSYVVQKGTHDNIGLEWKNGAIKSNPLPLQATV